MNTNKAIVSGESFETPTLKSRTKSMLKLDFYRLFHTLAFYIMILIAAIIPAMVLSMSGVETTLPDGTVKSGIELTNAWQIVESTGGSAAGNNPLDFGGYANINMLFIFAGLLMSIFIVHDYSSSFVKNIFAVHSKKIDYVIQKPQSGFLAARE